MSKMKVLCFFLLFVLACEIPGYNDDPSGSSDHSSGDEVALSDNEKELQILMSEYELFYRYIDSLWCFEYDYYYRFFVKQSVLREYIDHRYEYMDSDDVLQDGYSVGWESSVSCEERSDGLLFSWDSSDKALQYLVFGQYDDRDDYTLIYKGTDSQFHYTDYSDAPYEVYLVACRGSGIEYLDCEYQAMQSVILDMREDREVLDWDWTDSSWFLNRGLNIPYSCNGQVGAIYLSGGSRVSPDDGWTLYNRKILNEDFGESEDADSVDRERLDISFSLYNEITGEFLVMNFLSTGGILNYADLNDAYRSEESVKSIDWGHFKWLIRSSDIIMY